MGKIANQTDKKGMLQEDVRQVEEIQQEQLHWEVEAGGGTGIEGRKVPAISTKDQQIWYMYCNHVVCPLLIEDRDGEITGC